MIPEFIAKLGTKVIAMIGAGLLLLGLVWFGWHQWTKANQAAAETRVVTQGARAATESGADAVNTVGKAQGREQSIDQTVKENADAIRKAPGADAPVDAGLDAIGRRSLCRHAASARNPDCMQFTPAR